MLKRMQDVLATIGNMARGLAPRALYFACAALLLATPQAFANEHYDLLIRNGSVYDGSGAPPRLVDVAIRGDRVAALLEPGADAEAHATIDARGQAVAPGFINVLSWATESLIADGRGMSDTKQGVTLEIFGEGWSMGPLNPEMKKQAARRQGDLRYDIEWTTRAPTPFREATCPKGRVWAS